MSEEHVEQGSRSETAWPVAGALLAAVVIAGALTWSIVTGGPWLGSAEYGIAAALLVAAAAATHAILRGHVQRRITIAATLALGVPLMRASERLGCSLEYRLWETDALGDFAALVVAIGAIALFARRGWARWLALASAAVGIGTGGLNLVGTLPHPRLATWVFALSLAFSLLVGALLHGPRVRAACERGAGDSLWRSPDPVVRWTRLALVAQLVAIPMLLVYGTVQTIVPVTGAPALALAALLGLAATLAVRRKLMGAALLAMGGPSLLLLTAVTMWQARLGGQGDLWIASYYAVFWVPAGVLATVAGVTLARPVLRLWRRLE